MSTTSYVEPDIIDHCCGWSRTGSDGACPDGHRTDRQLALKSPSGVDPAFSIGRGAPIVSADPANQGRPWRRSAPAAPTATTKSP